MSHSLLEGSKEERWGGRKMEEGKKGKKQRKKEIERKKKKEIGVNMSY